MSRCSTVPSYRLHKQSGQAVVTLPDGTGGRHDILLGPHDTTESRQEYLRVLGEWEAAGRRVLQRSATPMDITIAELILAYWKFAEGYYVKNGEPTTQLERVRRSLKPVRELYGHTRAADFGPLSLKAVRETMLRAEWVRRHINHCVGCIKRCFKWGVENELVPSSVGGDVWVAEQEFPIILDVATPVAPEEEPAASGSEGREEK